MLCVSMGVSAAGIYKWVDKQGNVHFGDRPPVTQNAEPVELKPNTYQGVTIEPFEAFKREPSRRNSRVVMYSTTWCGVCKRARRYFQQQNIPFAEYDVEKTDKGRQDFRRLNGRGVPIILVGDKRMNGFSVERFRMLQGR
jgi:glutaredoxin